MCGDLSNRPMDICPCCEVTLPYNTGPCCVSCALPLPIDLKQSNTNPSNHTLLCGQCQQKPTGASKAIACFYYKPPITDVIINLKFKHQLYYGHLLGHLMAAQLNKSYGDQRLTLPQYIIPVPLHHQRLRQRGFNQASLLAKPISQTLGIPICYNLVKRQRDTTSQSALSAKKRRQNIHQAFTLTQPLHADCVAILDDVITTGSTARELCKTLLTSGNINKVHIWGTARALG